MTNEQKFKEVLAMLKDTIDKLETGFYGKDDDFNVNPLAEDIGDFRIYLFDNLGATVDE